MKKTYLAPELTIENVQMQAIIALSLSTEKADISDALVGGDGDWGIWGEE